MSVTDIDEVWAATFLDAIGLDVPDDISDEELSALFEETLENLNFRERYVQARGDRLLLEKVTREIIADLKEQNSIREERIRELEQALLRKAAESL